MWRATPDPERTTDCLPEPAAPARSPGGSATRRGLPPARRSCRSAPASAVSALLLALGLLLSPGDLTARTCIPGASLFEVADAVFSVIPMQGALSIEENVTYFQVDVFRVWKGAVEPREAISVSMPRMLSLGDKSVLPTSRNTSGEFAVGACTPVVEAHLEQDWIEQHLGTPQIRYEPALLQAR